MNKGTAQTELLFHPPGKFPCRTVEKIIKTGTFGQVVDPPASFCCIMPEKLGKKLQILLHGQREVEVFAQSLRHISDFRTNFIPVLFAPHVAAKNSQTALLHRPRSGNQREHSRFAHPVRTDQADQTARSDLQRKILQCGYFAVRKIDMLQLDCRSIGFFR